MAPRSRRNGWVDDLYSVDVRQFSRHQFPQGRQPLFKTPLQHGVNNGRPAMPKGYLHRAPTTSRPWSNAASSSKRLAIPRAFETLVLRSMARASFFGLAKPAWAAACSGAEPDR